MQSPIASASAEDKTAKVRAPPRKKADMTPEELQKNEEDKKAKARERNRRNREKKRMEAASTKTAAAPKAGASSPSPPATPVPSPRKTKRPLPATDDKEKPAKKKSKTNVAAPVEERAHYLGTAPVLEEANLVLNASPMFQEFARFATTDPAVNQAMASFLAKAPVSYDPEATPTNAFLMWLKANLGTFAHIANVFHEFTKSVDDLTEDQREALTAGPLEDGEIRDDEDSDAELLDAVDSATMDWMISMGFGAPPTKKKKKENEVVVKHAPLRDKDSLFAPFVAMAAKKPRAPVPFFIALNKAGSSALTLPGLLALVKQTSPAGTSNDVHKKTLGITLAAFKWLFPKASE
jgi:hypothetical protein